MPKLTPTLVHHKAALDGTPYPAHSLESIQACVEANAAVVEIDITALADADYLVVHDPALHTETTGRGAVSLCTADAARKLRIRQAGQITPYRVPLLSDVVALLSRASGSTRLQLDLKDTVPAEEALLTRLIRLIEPLEDRVIVSSTADWQLRRLRRLAPRLQLGFDIQMYLDWHPLQPTRRPPFRRGAYDYWDDQPPALYKTWPVTAYLRDRCEVMTVRVPGVHTFYVRHQLLIQALRDGFNWAAELHARGIQLDAWTMDVSSPEAMQGLPALIEAGVDLITTNTPLALAAHLRQDTGAK